MKEQAAAEDWDVYLRTFHGQRPGITERILCHSVDPSGSTPYGWLADRIPPAGLVVDVACGSAPLWSSRLNGRYLGVDVSAAELELARRRGAERLAVGSADALPVGDGAVAAVVCSMALMVLPDLPSTLTEVRRVLSPDGVFVAIYPTAPSRAADLLFGAGLTKAAGGRLGYRNDAALRHPHQLLARYGLTIVEDHRMTYRFGLTGSDRAAEAAASLYLRGRQAEHEDDVRLFLQAAARQGRTLPVPIRGILAKAVEE
ncbi:class I SAM-dependent methyltransferase [Humibacter antri]